MGEFLYTPNFPQVKHLKAKYLLNKECFESYLLCANPGYEEPSVHQTWLKNLLSSVWKWSNKHIYIYVYAGFWHSWHVPRADFPCGNVGTNKIYWIFTHTHTQRIFYSNISQVTALIRLSSSQIKIFKELVRARSGTVAQLLFNSGGRQ